MPPDTANPTAYARHVRNALNKAGVKVGDLTAEQRNRGKALAAWIVDGPPPQERAARVIREGAE